MAVQAAESANRAARYGRFLQRRVLLMRSGRLTRIPTVVSRARI